MNKNQFFYTRKENKPVQIQGQDPQYNEFLDSFNLDLIIRSVELDDKRRLVLLSDMHERLEKVPQGVKNGKMIYTKERNTFQSEIYLNEEDSKRFVELFK